MKALLSILGMRDMTNTTLAHTTGAYADVNGLKMYYEVHGDGFPLVLIHGGGSTIGTSFGRILPALAKTHRVIAVELQAHGHTADIDRPLSFEQDADDVAELLQQLGIGKADMFGFSNGASTTLEMAIRHPELVNKIVVASTMYNRDGASPQFWDMIARAKFEEMPQPYKDAFLQINPDTEALYIMFKRDVARMQSFRDIKQDDIRSIKVPALIIVGNNDVPRPEHGVEMYRQMQHATLLIVPGVHGEYMGEITTVNAGHDTYPALSFIETFLNEPMQA